MDSSGQICAEIALEDTHILKGRYIIDSGKVEMNINFNTVKRREHCIYNYPEK